MASARICAAGKELEMIGGTRGPFFKGISRKHTIKADTEHRRKFTRLATFLLGFALSGSSATAFAATAPLNCSLPSPTDTLPTTQRPSTRSNAATSALSNVVPVDINGSTSGTSKTITVALIGNSNSVVYAAGTVDALRATGRLRPELRLLEAGFSLAGVTEWASLASGSPLDQANTRLINQRFGMPQVVIWWTVKIHPDVNGTATRADVVAGLKSIKTMWPTVKVVYVAEMHGAAYLDPSVSNPLTRHSAIAREAALFHQMESDQQGVPAGMVLLHLPMVTNGIQPNALVGGNFGWQCHMHRSDAIHPTSREVWGLAPGEIDSQPLVGDNISDRLSVDPALQFVLFGTTAPPPQRIPLPDATLEVPSCVIRATVNGTVQSTQAPTSWCTGF
jgi:hypothetical protein